MVSAVNCAKCDFPDFMNIGVLVTAGPSNQRSVIREDSDGRILCVELISLAGGLERVTEFMIASVPLVGSTEGGIIYRTDFYTSSLQILKTDYLFPPWQGWS